MKKVKQVTEVTNQSNQWIKIEIMRGKSIILDLSRVEISN